MSTAEFSTQTAHPTPELQVYRPVLHCPRCWEGKPGRVADRFAQPAGVIGIRPRLRIYWTACDCGFEDCERAEQDCDDRYWQAVRTTGGYILVKGSERFELKRLPAVTPTPKRPRRRTWRATPRANVDSPFPCWSCHRPFHDIKDLYGHLQSGCWSYDDVGAIPRTTLDIYAELAIRRSWSAAISHGDNDARNAVLVSLAPLFRSKIYKSFGSDRTGDFLSIAFHSAAVEIEKARSGVNHPLRNGDAVFPDPRIRPTANSLRELKEAVSDVENESVTDTATSVKTVFEWFANTAATDINHSMNGWQEIIDGKTHWHGGDRNHGVTAVPAKKKGGKAKGKCQRRPQVMGPDTVEYTRHNRYLVETDAGVVREADTTSNNQNFRESAFDLFDLDSCIKFDPEHNHFVQIWDWLTILMAVEQHILAPGGEVNVEGWLETQFSDPKDREVLQLKAEGLSHAEIAKITKLTVSKVKTRLKKAEVFCRQELGVPLPEKKAVLPKVRTGQVVKIHDIADLIDARRMANRSALPLVA